jgi:transposase-like protein
MTQENLMIAVPCRRCGSTNVQKNGRTQSGQQKVHSKACHLYGTLDTKEAQRQQQWQTGEQLQQERLSQPAISRITGLRRNTIAAMVKKF